LPSQTFGWSANDGSVAGSQLPGRDERGFAGESSSKKQKTIPNSKIDWLEFPSLMFHLSSLRLLVHIFDWVLDFVKSPSLLPLLGGC